MTLCKLNDYISIKHGYAFEGEFFTDKKGDLVLLTPGNFAIGGGYQEGKKYFTGTYPIEYVLKPHDLVVTMTDLSKKIDTLGYPALVPNDKRTYLHNQRIGLVEFKTNELDKHYLFYLMCSYDYQRFIAGSSTGATVHHTSPSKICNYSFNLPPLDTQKKIADILGAYDELIENNRRQIFLLEEAAQRLYKEWFINLRFPGHETTPIDPTTNLPHGWKRVQLEKIAKFRRGKTITAKIVQPGKIPVIAGGLSPAYYHSQANTQAPVITISGSGANAGYTKLHTRDIWASDCSYLDTSSTKHIFFLYLTVKTLGNDFKHLQKGSAQPHVYPKHINELVFVLPNDSLLKKFEDIVTSIYIQVKQHSMRIQNAQEARDRLLPKLMSGELEVSA